MNSKPVRSRYFSIKAQSVSLIYHLCHRLLCSCMADGSSLRFGRDSSCFQNSPSQPLMAATSYRGRYGGGRDHTHSSSLRRSISPSGALRCSSASAFASSSASAFASSSPCSSALLHRSASLIRVIFAGPSPSPRSVRFAVASFHGNHSQKKPAKRPVVGSSDGGGRRRMCMCSPTTHPGSFRCRLHKGIGGRATAVASSSSSLCIRLNARPSAMTNSLVRWRASGCGGLSPPSTVPPPTSSGATPPSSPDPAASPSCPRPATTIPDDRRSPISKQIPGRS
ncbi:unnamed protein product [Musa acuminata subsp. malaccensis]|uniref:(wild Malaysian banana) hypothetical protein n=1 Tax=Musa acuminata subsp. malaccensis TaxID=214687 RepID=A0A804HNT9_MUSAM|nr:unnamed protein product [Musa acuminata subsp. malaccensis]